MKHRRRSRKDWTTDRPHGRRPRERAPLLAEQQEMAAACIGVVRNASRSFSYYHDPDELLSLGLVVLCQAASDWSPSRGVSFRAWATVVCRGKMHDYIRSETTRPVVTKTVDQGTQQDEAPEVLAERKELVELAMGILNDRERALLRDIFWKGSTLPECSGLGHGKYHAILKRYFGAIVKIRQALRWPAA